MLNEKFLEESCIICDNIYSLTEIEQLGWDGFGESKGVAIIFVNFVVDCFVIGKFVIFLAAILLKHIDYLFSHRNRAIRLGWIWRKSSHTSNQ